MPTSRQITHPFRLAITAAAVVVTTTAVLWAPPAFAADSFGPAENLTLTAGASTSATGAFHLDPLTKKADVVLAFDTTGSMFDNGQDWEGQAQQLVSQIRGLIPSARFAVTSFQDEPIPAFEYGGPCNYPDYPFRVDAGFTTDAAVISSAITGFTWGSGCDVPEAYNLAFHDVASTSALNWDPGARRFLVVIGDQTGHDYAQHTEFSACPDAAPNPGLMTDPGGTITTNVGLPGLETTETIPPTYDQQLVDPGPDGVFHTADDLSTQRALDDLRGAGITMLWAHYLPHLQPPTPMSCHQQLAAYTGGIAADGATDMTSLATFIDNASTVAATEVHTVTVHTSPASYSAWASFGTPSSATGGTLSYPLAAPTDVSIPETFTAPAGTAPGTYSFDVDAVADGVTRATQHVTITVPAPNTPPSGTTVSCGVDPVPVGQAVPVSTRFTDPDAGDTHTATTTWGDGTAATRHSLPAGTVTDTATHSYAEAGTYSVSATVTDAAGTTDSAGCPNWVVVYDPAAGFVTGGGSIYSAPGSLVAQPNASGAATFGFVSKYTKGATTPTGNTQFTLTGTKLSFHSTDYQWLVVSGAKAQFKGTGTLNGVGGYSFLVTVTDGQVKGGAGTDAFRIKITDAAGAVVYDNRQGSGDTLAGATPEALTSGEIVIHD